MYDRVKETSTTTGTGNFTLDGAVTQFRTFSSVFTAGSTAGSYDWIYYAIAGQGTAEWEVGKGHITNATTLVRDSVFSSSNSGALVNFSAGTKDVFNTITADRMEEVWTKGETMALIAGLPMP